MKTINSIIRLRRDNEYNYSKIRDTFIPASGEICLVDTINKGLMAVCGDGVTTYGQLKYINNVFVYGYYIAGEFYTDINKTEIISHNENLIYIDKASYNIYAYNGIKYQILVSVPAASKDVSGILKLYDTTGNNTDGTMTQKSITDALKKKMEMTMDVENETLNLADGLI